MESSIAAFLMRWLACEHPPTKYSVQLAPWRGHRRAKPLQSAGSTRNPNTIRNVRYKKKPLQRPSWDWSFPALARNSGRVARVENGGSQLWPASQVEPPELRMVILNSGGST